MTGTVNGIGTHLSGERNLTESEIKKWAHHLPYNRFVKVHDYKIATESFVILWLPLIPLKTEVYYVLNDGVMNKRYQVVFYPTGEESVYWDHVKNSPIFYILPIGVVILILWAIVSSII